MPGSVTNQTQDIPSFLLAPQQELAFARGGSAVSQAAVILPAGLAAEEVRVRLGRLVERHEILRTTFLRLPGLRTPRQSVRESFAPAFATIEGAPLETVFRNEAAAVD